MPTQIAAALPRAVQVIAGKPYFIRLLLAKALTLGGLFFPRP